MNTVFGQIGQVFGEVFKGLGDATKGSGESLQKGIKGFFDSLKKK